MTKLIVTTLSIVVLAVTTVLLATVASAQEADPTAVFGEFADAVNAGDVDAALALFTEDATWVRGGRCPPGACAGQAAIRAELEKDVADNHRIDIVDVQVTGNTLTARIELRSDGTREAEGIDRVIQTVTLEFSERKISAIEVVPDLTDPQTSEIRSRRLPAAGGGYVSSTDVLLPVLLGVALAILGTLLVASALQLRPLGRKR